MAIKFEYKQVSLNQIAIPQIKIRQPQTTTEDFANTQRSIATHGILQELYCSLKIDGQPHPDGLLYLVDGLQRFTIAPLVGLATVPCKIRDNITQDELLLLQDTLNSHRIKQKPKERLEHLKRLMLMHPEWTIVDLAENVCEKEEKVRSVMSLNKLTDEALELVDRGKIKMTAGVFLASLPEVNQNDHLEEAIKMPADKFISHVATLKEAYRKARATGERVENVITPHPLKRKELIARWEQAQHEYELKATDITRTRVNTLAECLQVDEKTLALKKAERDKNALERQEKVAKKKAEDAKNEVADVLNRKKAADKLAESVA